jgi:outer membrane receptor protein involved in Fe transport
MGAASSSHHRPHRRRKSPFILTPLRGCVGLLGLPFAILLILCIGSPASRLLGAEPDFRSFAIPAAEAEVTLEAFSEQAGVQIVYLLGDVHGVTTNPIQGAFAIRAALDRLVAGTELRIEHDGKTGAFVIKRERKAQTTEKPGHANTVSSPHMKKPLVTRLTAALAAITAATLSAQTTATPESSATISKEESIVLSPFEVRNDTDNGYTATSALAGGRTEAPLKLTAAAISVMTSQFLEDIGSTNFNSAGEWSTNWMPFPDTNTNVAGAFQINYRNMGATFASRNYFLWYIESDSYNTERYEFARGPNGVLFGDAGAGGISTTWTKRPRFDRAANSVNVRATSFGGYRTSIDFNRPITKNFALRLNSFYESSPTNRDYTDSNRVGTHLAGAVRLTPRNQFRFEGEYGLQRRILYPNYYADQGSYWNGTTNYNGVTAPSTTGTGVARISTSNYFVYIPGTANNGLNDWGPYYQSTGTGLGLLPTAEARADIPNSPRLPNREFNFQPPDSITRLRYYTYSFYLDHRFNDNLFAEVAFNRERNDRQSYGSQSLFSTYRIDVNTVLPGGATNPNYGKAFSDAERVRTRQGNTVSDIRALLNWRYENNWLKESVSAISGSRLDIYDYYSRTMRRVNGTNPNLTNAANLVRERRYWDQAGLPLGPVPAPAGAVFDFVPTSITHQRKILDYIQVASISRFFNDRLALTLGARRDGVKNSQQTTSGVPVDAVTGLPQIGAVNTPPGSTKPVATVGSKSVADFKPFSRNIGAVYFVRPWIGVFANYSETFQAPGAGNNLLDGSPPQVSESKGMDMGLKVELFESKVSGSLSYYTSKQKALLINGTRTTEINRIWTNINRVDLATIAYRDTQDQKGDGYEVDLNANPTRNLRLTFNLALPTTSAIDLEPGLIAYFKANLKTWQDAVTNGTSTNPTQVNTDITTITNYIAALTPGTPLNNTYKYTGNIYATYTFPNGRLKNLSIGGGANMRGKAKVASTLANAYDYLYANDYYLIAAHATYRYRFSKNLNVRFQLNVSNVLDNDKAIYNSYSTYRVSGLAANPLVQVPNTIRIVEPRKFTLSTTFDF